MYSSLACTALHCTAAVPETGINIDDACWLFNISGCLGVSATLQDIISRVLTSHTKVEGQGISAAADNMSKLQRAYNVWRQALLATQAPVSI